MSRSLIHSRLGGFENHDILLVLETGFPLRLKGKHNDKEPRGDEESAARVHWRRGLQVCEHGDDRLRLDESVRTHPEEKPHTVAVLTATMPKMRFAVAASALPVPRSLVGKTSGV